MRVFGHFGLLGAWNVVRELGGSVFVNGGRRLEEEGCSVVKCVMGEKKGNGE
ncbi:MULTISPECIES: hypothetical protein [unclassified Bartonella]|uniref:hypothetical protein n=1 Tax=unclassified Bartonella TaxID=2645622 RepID=UPI0035CEE094